MISDVCRRKTVDFMKQIIYIIIAGMGLLLDACGHGDCFRVDGMLSEGSDINLRIVYYTDGNVLTGITASNAGKFVFEGRAPKPALVEVYDNDYRLLGRFMANDGEDIHVNIDRDNPYGTKVEGNALSVAMTGFFNSNADKLISATTDERNAVIAGHIKENPEAPEAYLLLITEFYTRGHEQLADSLLALIPDDARIQGISAGFEAMLRRVTDGLTAKQVAPVPYLFSGKTHMFRPSGSPLSLIVLSDSRSGRDSIVSVVRDLDSRRGTRFDILDLNLDRDTLEWRRTVRSDSASWTQGWAAGGISAQAIDRLGVPQLPFFVLVDSAGHQLWRGSSATVARSQTLKYLK